MWISFNGLQNGAYTGISFPYVAYSPLKQRKSEYGCISDVYDELVGICALSEAKGFKLGKGLYDYSFHFADHTLLVDNKIQDRIKEYQFCKQFKCPPYPSLQETPYEVIDDFLIIEEEFNNCIEEERQEKKNA